MDGGQKRGREKKSQRAHVEGSVTVPQPFGSREEESVFDGTDEQRYVGHALINVEQI